MGGRGTGATRGNQATRGNNNKGNQATITNQEAVDSCVTMLHALCCVQVKTKSRLGQKLEDMQRAVMDSKSESHGMVAAVSQPS